MVATDDDEELNLSCVEFGYALQQHAGRLRDQVPAFANPPAHLLRRKEIKGAMLDEQSKLRVKELCDLIAKEQDHHRFSSLVEELNRLLDDGYTTPAPNSKKEKP